MQFEKRFYALILKATVNSFAQQQPAPGAPWPKSSAASLPNVQAARLTRNNGTEIWVKELDGGSKAGAFFNRGDGTAAAILQRSALKITSRWRLQVRVSATLGNTKELGEFEQSFQANVPAHGTKMLRIRPSRPHSAQRN
jgi:Alpha galactosidase C-terminal beta sandwich domain